MHPGRRAALEEQAHKRVVAAAATLGQRFGLDAIEIPTTVNVRRPQEAQLEQQQAVATLLEALVEKTAESGTPGDELAGLGLSSSTVDALTSAGITSRRQLAQTSDEELLALRGVGSSALGAIRNAVPAESPPKPAPDEDEEEDEQEDEDEQEAPPPAPPSATQARRRA